MLHVLFEDNHCLALAKPAGALTTGYQGTEEPLDRIVKQYLKAKYRKPGNVFLGVVHRLDRLTSGVLLYARNSKAAARLARQFREGTVEKVYWAIVEGRVQKSEGTLEAWLRKDRDAGRVESLPPKTAGARHSVLHFRRRGMSRDYSWLEVRPETGRTHQIRVQLAELGHPVYGDRKYGSKHALKNAITLHARFLTFRHPVRPETITLIADLPAVWGRFRGLFRFES
jgi:23S rRNA pseudouridine1911/1915/1917 synthase